jgi:hypothetical protein
VLVTTDKNMRYQQNLAGRKIAIIVSGKQQWPELRPHVQLVVSAVSAATPGTDVSDTGRELASPGVSSGESAPPSPSSLSAVSQRVGFDPRPQPFPFNEGQNSKLPPTLPQEGALTDRMSRADET